MKPNYLTVLLLLFSFISLSLISNVSAKSNPVIYIYVTPGVSFYAGANATISCGQYLGDAGANLKLYRDVYEVANGTATSYPPVAEYAHLLPGHYIYTCIYVESANYNTYAVYQEVTSIGLSQAVTVSVLPEQIVEYGTQTTVGCAIYSGFKDSLLNLYRNGTLVASGTGNSYPPASETKVLPAGMYEYTCTASGSDIYMNATSSPKLLRVDKKYSSVSIGVSPSITLCENNLVTVTCARIDGNSTIPLTLYKNDAIVASGITNPQFISEYLNPTGVYNYTCFYPGDDNWIKATAQEVVSNGTYIDVSMNFNTNMVNNTWVSEGAPNTNFATSLILRTISDSAGGLRSYIKIKISDDITTIYNATIRLHQSGTDQSYLHGNQIGSIIVYAYRVNTTATNDIWSEDDITWNNQPCGNVRGDFNGSCKQIPTDWETLTYPGGVELNYVWDVTDFAQEALGRDSRTFTLIFARINGESTDDWKTDFTSSRNATEPPFFYLRGVSTNITGNCTTNIIIGINETGTLAGSFHVKFMNLMVSSQGAVLIIITFISAIIAKIFNEEMSLYITSALIFICGILTFFPLWIGLTGSIFGTIVAIMLGKKGVSD